jgi:hypothetical protein
MAVTGGNDVCTASDGSGNDVVIILVTRHGAGHDVWRHADGER